MKRWKKRSYIRKQEWLQIEDYYKETLDEMKKEQTEIRQHIEKLSDKIDNFCAKMEQAEGGIQEELGVLEKLIKMLLVNSLLDEVEHNTDSILNHSEKKNIEVLTTVGDRKDIVEGAVEKKPMYGSYYRDKKNGGIIAGIGCYTDTGADYISLSCLYLNSVKSFIGTITYLDDGSMLAKNEIGKTIHFEYNGSDQIKILFVDNIDFSGFEGIYQRIVG